MLAIGAIFDGFRGNIGLSYHRPDARYHSLDPTEIVKSERALSERIKAKFPGRGIDKVSDQLSIACQRSLEVSERLSKPNWWLRSIQYFVISILIFSIAFAISRLEMDPGINDLFEVVQGIESSINDFIFIAVAVWFVMRLESSWKRRISLRSLHTIRSIAHVIDMHQLSKDPQVLGSEPSKRDELLAYLDFCSDMLAITSKAAAIHAQGYEDHDTLSAVREIEALTDGFRNRIWQKIAIIERRINH